MNVIFHIGAHCTGQERLIRSLLKNRDALAKEGIAVPGPGRYRRVLSDALLKLRGQAASAETQDVLLDAVLDFDDAERIILSNENFISMPSNVIHQGELYGKIDKSAWLRAAFPSARAEFAVALRNVATFLPALVDLIGPDDEDISSVLREADPTSLTWYNVIAGIRNANPDSPILVWCDEDSPIIWPEIMREVAGIDPLVPLEGEDDLARSLLCREGNEKLSAYLAEKPPEDEATRRRIVANFLANFAVDDAFEQEVELPGWNQQLIDDLTEYYDEDLEKIATIPGVTVLTP